MKKAVFFFLLLLFLVSCRKRDFHPCQEYESIVGTWESITGDGTDIITITADGKYTYDSALERDWSYKFWSCEYTSYSYFRFSIDRKMEDFLIILTNATFDTIISGNGAYNHTDSSMVGGGRKFVKIN